MSAVRIRPVRPGDLDGLSSLAARIRGGLTSLPPDRDLLGHKIDESIRAFDKPVRKPAGEFYLFVLEDLESGEVAGTSAILARVGGFDPFYSYEIRRETFSHEPLAVRGVQSLPATGEPRSGAGSFALSFAFSVYGNVSGSL